MVDKTAGQPRRRCSLRRGEAGQTSLEFVLILPIVVLFSLLVVDLSVLMYHYVSISNAAREGARFGAVSCGDGECTDDQVKDRIIARSGGILADPTQLRVDWVDINGNGLNFSQGDAVVVRINHPYDFLFSPGSIDVITCASMRLEQTDRNDDLPSTQGDC